MFQRSIHRAPKTRWAKFFLMMMGCSTAQATYPNLDSMLEAIRPNAAIIAPELNALIVALDAIPTSQQKFDALQTLAPLADGSLLAASEGPNRQMLEAIHDRLIYVLEPDSGYAAGDVPASISEKKKTTGLPSTAEKPRTEQQTATNETPVKTAAGTTYLGKGVWLQILGEDILQRERDDVPGYKAFVYGGILGRDWLVTPQFAWGVAGGYQHARAVSRNSSGSLLGIKRLHGTLYGKYLYEFCPLFLQGALTVAHNDYDSDRKILVPPFGGVPYARIAQADYAAWEGNANVETGFIWKKKQFRAIPKLMLTYSHLDPEGYVENDAFELNLDVKYQDMDALTLGGGLKLEYQNEFPKAYVVPEIHGYVFHDFLKDKPMASAYFISGGYAFLTQGAQPDPTTIEVGAGIAVHSYKNVLVNLRYDYVTRDDYHRHQGFIKVRYEWC